VITFHREDLLPYEQNLYDDEGNLETNVIYQDYKDFGSGLYPSTITIKRPLEDKQIVMLVDKESQIDPTTLPAGEFELSVPATVPIKNLD
jgi:hypothetical protein